MDWSALARRLMGRDGPEIRPMRPEDIEEVLRLIRLHDSDDYKAARASFPPERFRMPEDVTAHFVILDPEEGEPVGVSGYYVDDLEAQGLYWLGWTYVNPFRQGHGYGGKLMEFVLEALRTIGARKLYLSTSSLEKYAVAVGFYERYGFELEGRLTDYYSDGEDKLIMGRRLEAPIRRASGRPGAGDGAPVRHRGSAGPGEEPGAPPKRDREGPADDDGKESGGGGVVFEF